MNITEAIRVALGSLWANKLRSVLTLLGVVIGVAAVIAVVTFAIGINRYVEEKIFNLGADVFIVSKQPNVITNVDQLLEGQKRKDLTYDDYRAISEGCTECKYVAATIGNMANSIKYNEQSSSGTFVRGWTPTMSVVYDLDLASGRMLTEGDLNNSSNVAIVGNDIVQNLMGGVDPLGKEIRVDGQVYRVIGVGAPKGKTLGQSQDDWVAIPITAWLKQYGAQKHSLRVWAKARATGAPLESAMDQCRVIMRARRHDLPGKPDTFEIETNANLLSIWTNISQTFFVVMIALASISLVVGGIVIMNMMLVSVTERTREIGIRMALGARGKDILRQFLIEASTLALVGGFLGVVMGIAVAEGVTLLIGMPSAIALWAVLAGLTVALSVGIFFGVYPASKAAKLDPISALRFEL
jgi:putative ABC transport system permease protein